MTVIESPEGIEFVQLLARRGALALEIKGLKGRGRSAYSICKEVYGLKGSRENVLKQMDKMVEEAQLVRRYEVGGQEEVYRYVNKHHPDWEWAGCEACEDITPTWDDVCAVCFTKR